MRRSILLFTAVFLAISVSVLFGGAITESLREKMEQSDGDVLIRVNVVMQEQADFAYLTSLVRGKQLDERREMVIDHLKSISERTQAPVLSFLKERKRYGEVGNIRSLWIANVICVTATKEVIGPLAQFPGVRSVDWDERRVLIKPMELAPYVPAGREIAWGVDKVRAPLVWPSYTGAGIIVSLIDTGVRYTHNDLADHIWTNPGEIPGNGMDDDGNGYTDDYYGYDFVNNDSDPMDDYGHGSHCAGSVASDGTAGSQCGVAPDARIMSLKVLDSGGGGTEAGVWEAIQYTIDNGGQVISMSLGWSHAWSPDRPTWRNTCNAALAAGVVMSVAGGNENNSYGAPDNIRTPGDCPPPWLHPDQTLTGGLSAVVTVGATDINDAIASFSSIGPVSWEGIAPWNDYPYNPEMGLIDPDVSAPGVNIKSLSYTSDNGYADGWSGTSMATPHVAGAMALLLEKNPTLTQAVIDSILEVTAVELGAAGKDNTFGAGRIDCYDAINATPGPDSPDEPSLVSPFNFVRLPDLQPTLHFVSTDPQSDDIQYRVYWDTDPTFASPDSSTTPLYASGMVVDFTIPSALTDGETYWWRVRCTDPGGSGSWSSYSDARSLTIGTALPSNTWTWYQNTNAQFQFCALAGTEIEGDSIVLGGTVPDTVLVQGFEPATFPPTGWARFAGPGNGSSNDWLRKTDEAHSGSASAGIDYDGSNTVDRFLATSSVNLSGLSNCELAFWHRDNWASYYKYHGIWASTASQTNPADYSEVEETGPTAEDTWQEYSADISAYSGMSSVYLAFRYDELDGTDWWVDDVAVIGYSQGTMGSVIGTPVAYVDFPVRMGWDRAYWTKSEAADSIMLQIEYLSGGAWALVPDGALPGNSAGFLTSMQTGEVDIAGLDTTVYDTLRLSATLMSSAVNPAMLNWEVGVFTDMETDPPEPFSLLSPADLTLTANNRPTFFWESTVDLGIGLRDYRIYIEGILRNTGTDTSWTADYNLDEGSNVWYVVATDFYNNARQSTETWTVIVDTTGPSQVTLVSPADNTYLDISTFNLVWNSATDNIAGVDHYVLQYALNSGFSSGLVETTLTDTTCSVTLADTIYYWHVRAVDALNNVGLYSTTWQFEVDTDVPAAPSLISPVGGVWLTNTSVDFSWTAVTFDGADRTREVAGGARENAEMKESPGDRFRKAGERSSLLATPVRYIVQIDTNASFTSPIIIDTVAVTNTSHVLAEDIYYWRVRAYDLAGNQGSFSSDADFGVDVTPPSTVSLVSPADGIYLNSSTVNLIWNAATDNLSGVDHYVLQYALDSGFSSGLVETTLTDTACSVVLADTIYYWHVRAVDVATNDGNFSTTWQFEVDTDVPAAPSLISPVGGVWLTNTSVDFQWSTVTFADESRKKKGGQSIILSPVRYIIQVDTSSSFTAPVAVETLLTNSTTIVLSEDIYYWHVRAYDLAGNEGPFAAYELFGIDLTAPVIESTTVWTDTAYAGPFEIATRVTDNLSGVDSVQLFYMRDEDPSWVMEVMNQAGDWFTDTIPAVSGSNDTVRYYIRAIDVATHESTDPTGAPSSFYWFIANMMGIEAEDDMPARYGFGVPTFANDRVTFSLVIPARSTITLKIYDITGRVVAKPFAGSYAAGHHHYSFTPARTGVYFYKMESRYERRTGKIIVF